MNNRCLLPSLYAVMLALILCPQTLRAQVATAGIAGYVTDQSEAVLPGVRITATHRDIGLTRSATSTAHGSYSLSLLPPGMYQLEAEASGFRTYVVTEFGPLTVGQVARANIVMQIGPVAERIEVTAPPPVVEAESATVGTLIERRRVADLPLSGRNPFDLMRLAPNVNFLSSAGLGTTGFGTGLVSMSGGQMGSNSFLMDGGVINMLQENEPKTLMSVESVEEFRIHTNNLSAEFGQTGGGVVNLITRGGTNSWRGSAYNYFRNDALDANSWANNRLGRPKNVLRYNQFGFSQGGPVSIPRLYDGKNRTFFFFNYEGVRRSTTSEGLSRVPSALEKRGDLSQTYIVHPSTRQLILVDLFDPLTTRPNPAGTGFVRDPFPSRVLPASRLDSLSAAALKYSPDPTRPADDLTGTRNMMVTASSKSPSNNYVTRIDHQVTPANRLFGRHVLNLTSRPPGGDSTFSADNPLDPTGTYSSTRNQQFVLADTHIFTPTLLNEFRLSITRENIRVRPLGYGEAMPSKLGLPAGYPQDMSPRLIIADMYNLGSAPDKVANRLQVTGGITNTVTKITGKHNIKAGVDLRVFLDNNYQPMATSGQFSFGRDLTGNPQSPAATGHGFATFLLGAVSSGFLDWGIAKADGYRYYSAFLQDDYKVNPRLTLNLGLRYEYIGAPTERFDRYSNFNPHAINSLTGTPGVVQFAGRHFGRSVLEADRNDFGPRLGFAYDILGSNRLIARGGYGVFYYQPGGTLILGPYMGFSTRTTYPSLGPYAVFQFKEAVPFINRPAGTEGGDATFLGSGVSAYQTTERTPYVQQWNFGLQYGLPWNDVIEVSYAGNRGVKQPASNVNLNQLHPDYLALGFALSEQVPNPFRHLGIFGNTISRQQSLLPYPAYTSVDTNAPRFGSSTYHSVLVRWEKRWSNGISYLVSFTGAKTIGDVGRTFSDWMGGGLSTACGQNALFDRRSCRSIEPNDISRRAVASFVYELPFGRGKPLVTSGIGGAVLGGWQVNSIFEWRVGQPLAIRGASNQAADRPHYLRSARMGSDERSENRWFDTGAFAQPELFVFGNAPRTLPDVRSPGVRTLDCSLMRNISLGETITLQIRAEAFNALNSVNLTHPNANFLAGAFGTITGARAARVMQLGMRFDW